MDFNEDLCFLIMSKVRKRGRRGMGEERYLGDSDDGIFEERMYYCIAFLPMLAMFALLMMGWI